jgi:hypothetical protein
MGEKFDSIICIPFKLQQTNDTLKLLDKYNETKIYRIGRYRALW